MQTLEVLTPTSITSGSVALNIFHIRFVHTSKLLIMIPRHRQNSVSWGHFFGNKLPCTTAFTVQYSILVLNRIFSLQQCVFIYVKWNRHQQTFIIHFPAKKNNTGQSPQPNTNVKNSKDVFLCHILFKVVQTCKLQQTISHFQVHW